MIKKIKQAGAVTGRLRPFIAPYKWGFIGAVVMTVVSVAAMTSAPRIEGMITTRLAKDAAQIAGKVPGAGVRFDVIVRILAVLAAVYIIKMASQVISMFLLTNSIQSAMHDMRNAVQDKIRRLPVKYFDTHSFGDTLSRVTNDIDSVSNGLQQSFTQVISGVLTLILVLVMVFTIQPVMAWLVVLIIPVSILISVAVVRKSQKHFKAQQDSLGELNGTITELYTGYNEILLFGRQQSSRERFKEINGRLQKHALKAQFVSSMMSPLISLTVYLCIGGVAVSGTVFVIQGMLTVGNLQAFIRYIWQCNEPLSQVAQLSAQIQAAFAGMKRIFEILDEPEEIPDPEPGTCISDVKGEVSFEHVAFGYGDKPVIKDLDIHIKSGQMVAIVGPTGAGKTTIINLLLRFYDTDSGRILIDGVDIKSMKREDLRSMFGMVLQDTWLFSGTIYENIRYGRLDARKDEVIDAAKTANVHHFIRTLPKGYDMEIDEEGSNISQGEKQLLTIARAVLKDPKILILDEATSSVDTRLEKILQEAMHKLLAGRTSFVIAHRLSTIKNADLILVLKEGRIVETGTHTELLEERGYYEQLYHSQFST
ncbi:ABC transporter ATP-binding protein [Anaerostipes faecis]|uniref:ABC transporter ATP-binding protein n=1 Tax=Anaerostipes faecis TaxID=2880702 RepID=UPI002657E8BC|nr:ABC transporter ATP-binding protein [Anaerostipes faecis]